MRSVLFVVSVLSGVDVVALEEETALSHASHHATMRRRAAEQLAPSPPPLSVSQAPALPSRPRPRAFPSRLPSRHLGPGRIHDRSCRPRPPPRPLHRLRPLLLLHLLHERGDGAMLRPVQRWTVRKVVCHGRGEDGRPAGRCRRTGCGAGAGVVSAFEIRTRGRGKVGKAWEGAVCVCVCVCVCACARISQT